MMTTRLFTSRLDWSPTRKYECTKQIYLPPELLFLGHAVDLILARIECQSRQVAKRIRRLIDEYDGGLSFSPTRECQKLQVDLSLVSRQFKKLYRVTIRSYLRQVRMKTAEELLRESDHLNIDEIAGIFG